MKRPLLVLLAIVLLALLLFGFARDVGGYEGCEPYPVTEHSPTGVVGCVVFGEGTASWWGGPGVARSDCRWPWDDCQPILITSFETGKSVAVVPSMYGDLYLGDDDPSNDRIVDLDPHTLARLGLDPARGLYPVRVDPIYVVQPFLLPDTAVSP